MLPLDVIAHRSRWRAKHPAEKAVLAFGLLLCAVLLPPWPGAVVVAATAGTALWGVAGAPVGALLRVLRAPLAFVTVGSVPLLVAVGGPTLIRYEPSGLPLAAGLAGRSTAAVLCLILFAATTPLADVLPRLVRLGVPAAVTEIAVLMYRMVFLLLDTLRAVREAQASRLGFRNWSTTYRSLAGQGAVVFLRAFDRARRMEEGLALRGYTGSLRVQIAERPVSRTFVAASLATVAGVVAATLALRGLLP